MKGWSTQEVKLVHQNQEADAQGGQGGREGVVRCVPGVWQGEGNVLEEPSGRPRGLEPHTLHLRFIRGSPQGIATVLYTAYTCYMLHATSCNSI